MSVFAAAMDRIFSHASMAAPALWISATTSEERPIRIIRRAPDRVTDFGAGRFCRSCHEGAQGSFLS